MHYRKKDDFVVIKYGAEWCKPCKEISPVLIDLAKKHRHVYFLDVDVDNEEISEHSDLTGVKKIPHIKFFVNQKLEREIIGKDIDTLYRYVERYSEIKLKEKKEEQENEQAKEDQKESDDQEESENTESLEGTEDKNLIALAEEIIKKY